MKPVRLQPTAPRSRVKHSTTEPLRSLFLSGEISLVCLGPIINIAMTIRMDPEFGKRLKECHIMGGTYQGKHAVYCCARRIVSFKPFQITLEL